MWAEKRKTISQGSWTIYSFRHVFETNVPIVLPFTQPFSIFYHLAICLYVQFFQHVFFGFCCCTVLMFDRALVEMYEYKMMRFFMLFLLLLLFL